MITRLPALLTLASVLALAGCGSSGDSGGEPEGPGGREEISYSKAGGIAGTSQLIEIAPDGATRIKLGYVDPETRTFKLPPAELEEIDQVFEDAGFDEIEDAGTETGCADCFLYEITRGDHTVTADSSNIPEEVVPITTKLDQLVIDQADPVK